MYLFLAVAALYTYYLFNSNYLKDFFTSKKSPMETNEINDSYLDEEIEKTELEPKEIELVELVENTKKNTDKQNDAFIEEEGWSLW
jgi:hypothetical protein